MCYMYIVKEGSLGVAKQERLEQAASSPCTADLHRMHLFKLTHDLCFQVYYTYTYVQTLHFGDHELNC